MSRTPSGGSALALALLGAFLSVPVAANVAPDAVIYFNVMPAGDPQSWCTSDITSCSQMSASTNQTGLIEFQIFIDSTWHFGEPVANLTAELIWPSAWQFVDGAVCRDGTGSLEYWGSNPHELQLEWSCDSVYEMFLAVTLVFDVQEYGRLEFGESSLWIGCPPEGEGVLPVTGVWGEAGTECEYTNQPCATYTFDCIPGLQIDEMTLTTVPGGMAHGETHFGGWQWFDQGCHGAFHVVTGETWCSGYVEDGVDEYDNILMIDADATGMGVGTYETWVQVRGYGSARCLNLILEVREPTAVTNTSWGRVKTLYRE